MNLLSKQKLIGSLAFLVAGPMCAQSKSLHVVSSMAIHKQPRSDVFHANHSLLVG